MAVTRFPWSAVSGGSCWRGKTCIDAQVVHHRAQRVVPKWSQNRRACVAAHRLTVAVASQREEAPGKLPQRACLAREADPIDSAGPTTTSPAMANGLAFFYR